MGGSADSVLEDFVTVMERADALGLELNTSKCELLVIGGAEATRRQALSLFRTTAPELRVMKLENLELLGAPLLNESIHHVLEKRSVKHKC